MDDTSCISDTKTLKTLIGRHWNQKAQQVSQTEEATCMSRETEQKEVQLLPWLNFQTQLVFREEIHILLHIITVKKIQITQNNLGTGADFFPPLLGDEVKLVC